jgi:hypothetical protein
VKYAKAIAAFVSGAATPLAALYATNGKLTSSDLIAALVTAVVSAGSVWKVKNATSTVAGLVVKVTADLDKFKAALDVALSQSLVIEPQPVAPVPVGPNAPTPPPIDGVIR